MQLFKNLVIICGLPILACNEEKQPEEEIFFRNDEITTGFEEADNDDELILKEIQNKALKNLNWKIKDVEIETSETPSKPISLKLILELVSSPKNTLYCSKPETTELGESETCCKTYSYGNVSGSVCCTNHHKQNKITCGPGSKFTLIGDNGNNWPPIL